MAERSDKNPSVWSPIDEDVMHQTSGFAPGDDPGENVWTDASKMVPPDPMSFASGSDAYGGKRNGKRK